MSKEGELETAEPRDLFTQENFQKFECDWAEKQETAFFRSALLLRSEIPGFYYAAPPSSLSLSLSLSLSRVKEAACLARLARALRFQCLFWPWFLQA